MKILKQKSEIHQIQKYHVSCQEHKSGGPSSFSGLYQQKERHIRVSLVCYETNYRKVF